MGGVSQFTSFLQKRLKTKQNEEDITKRKVMMMLTVRMTKVSPAFVGQQEEEQAAEDAGEAAVNADQQCRHGAVGLITVAAGTG